MNKMVSRVLIFMPLLVCSCSDITGKLLIMEANSRSSRGLYNEAISSYQNALEYAQAEPYAEYGLGLVYFTMGEDTAALDRFSNALQILEDLPSAAARELKFRIHYNTGVVLFSEGNFPGAVNSFREALKTDGSRVEAKRNLELCLQSLTQEDTSGSAGNAIESESKDVLYDFIQQRELSQWRNMVWPDEENITGPDY